MIRTLLCIFLISSILCGIRAQAQQKPATPPLKTDSLRKPATDTVIAQPRKDSSYVLPGGIRIGLDLSRIATSIYYPYRKEFTIIADARLKSNLYAAFEGGYANTPYSDDRYTYKGSGAFITLGIDYNFLKRQYPSEKNMFYVGARYGFSHLSYEVPTYTIESSYWGKNLTGSIPKSSVNAHWIELVVGLKAEIFKHFFMGWNLRERILINNVKTEDFTPLVIPGFGSGSKKSVFDVQYTVSYVLPLYNIREYVKLAENKKKKIPKR
ncbi:DUF6048 family protein [Chitinophaga nivalis]|uniref:DUF6048 family protein n=1 Tax=Chitinophaga nivalis TaxID=2991709 RepID=A0ABT3ITV7_9BACT|nr:DUF6048 family protein [Chitinophaga nivalis]MCW3462931.1 DUF6048 family protein [Chitinophaga nivalis]MCW3487379.1 DUF6048 family protein [Chitinophaga nivalis]